MWTELLSLNNLEKILQSLHEIAFLELDLFATLLLFGMRENLTCSLVTHSHIFLFGLYLYPNWSLTRPVFVWLCAGTEFETPSVLTQKLEEYLLLHLLLLNFTKNLKRIPVTLTVTKIYMYHCSVWFKPWLTLLRIFHWVTIIKRIIECRSWWFPLFSK